MTTGICTWKRITWAHGMHILEAIIPLFPWIYVHTNLFWHQQINHRTISLLPWIHVHTNLFWQLFSSHLIMTITFWNLNLDITNGKFDHQQTNDHPTHFLPIHHDNNILKFKPDITNGKFDHQQINKHLNPFKFHDRSEYARSASRQITDQHYAK